MSDRSRLCAELIAAFEAAGARVVSLAAVGDGCPDLLVGYRGRIALCELLLGPTGPRASCSPERLAWYQAWRGSPVTVLHTVDDVAHVLRTLERAA